MNYYLYLFICYITHPFRRLMFFWTQSDFHFATKLLFWNDYKNCWVVSQSRLETGDFKSDLCVKYNNYFAMGYTKNSPYQSQPKSSGGAIGEPSSFAIYTNEYKSVYDYYDLCYRRNAALGRGIDTNIPTANFKASSQENQNYLAFVTGVFKSRGYFTARLDSYASGILTKAWDYKSYNWRVYVNYLYAIIVPSALAVWLAPYCCKNGSKKSFKDLFKFKKGKG